jgi:hypothetical protein
MKREYANTNATWGEVLQTLERALATAEKEATRRERESGTLLPADEPKRQHAWQARLASLNQAIQARQEWTRHAEQLTDETHRASEETRDCLANWLAQAALWRENG